MKVMLYQQEARIAPPVLKRVGGHDQLIDTVMFAVGGRFEAFATARLQGWHGYCDHSVSPSRAERPP